MGMESPLTISTIESLPDELLAAILKIVADSPIPMIRRTPPFPITLSTLWTTIRLSHRSRSWKWAALFVERSRSRLLDISINLEAYTITNKAKRYGYDSPIRIEKALTLALDELVSYMLQSLESIHVSVIDEYHDFDVSQSLVEALAGSCIRALRINTRSGIPNMSGLPTLQSLDIALHTILGASSPLKTLVIRDFFASHSYPFTEFFDACNITILAIRFTESIFTDHSGLNTTYELQFHLFSRAFSLPNLEHLELTHAFAGSAAESRIIRVPEDWEPALFPTLRTLRLVDLRFSPKNLAFIQSFSQGITTLELIYTSANKHLDGGWPALSSFAVEGYGSSTRLRGLSTLTVSPPLLNIVRPIASASKIKLRILADGPSPSLADSPHPSSFYYDDDYLDIQDFEYTEVPVEPPTITMTPSTSTIIGGSSRMMRSRRRFGLRRI
ncbi:F-box domain-containing protein [Favolaschia claudopus]|uniref:F-box domain-containing protein n=1 Tax=Favolaschia claudopus TaxID=2862362 RepID=A0AAW0AFK6_9AGAR